MIFLDKEYDTVTTASPQNPLGNHFLQGYYNMLQPWPLNPMPLKCGKTSCFKKIK